LDSDDIALGAAEDFPEDREELLVGRGSVRSLLPLSPEDSSDGVTGEFEDLADLPDWDSSLREAQNGLLNLLGYLHDSTS